MRARVSSARVSLTSRRVPTPVCAPSSSSSSLSSCARQIQIQTGAGSTRVQQWCGPCKLIYPELVKINSGMEGVTVVKLNCNKKNKELGVKLGIKVAPTFYIYRDSVKLAEMTGAKVERLLALLKEQQQPPATENARPPLI
ncbi:MAG: hypothetical protein WDW38_008793 [Sanguina aurantia]